MPEVRTNAPSVNVTPVKTSSIKTSTLSEKAQKLGLMTREDVEKEFKEAKTGWSKGTEYHCAFCNKDFWSPSGARKHMKTQDHPVLRWDWY